MSDAMDTREDGRGLTGHAVVTGASRGIGEAIAVELARQGATVSLIGRDSVALDRVAGRIRDECRIDAHCAAADVSDDAALRDAFLSAREIAGPIRFLVNNAGMALGGAASTDVPRDAWDRIIAVNLTAAFVACQIALPDMVSAGRGRIVNVASIAGLRGVARIVPYTASKHGLIGITRSLALEYARSGITVNAVCPGYVETDMARLAVESIVAATGRTPEEARRAISRPSAFNRILEPDEVARTVAWLCSPDAATVTGQAIVIGGDVT